MSNIAIRIEGLAKKYRIGVSKQRHDTLRDEITEKVKSLFRRSGSGSVSSDTIWALKDVSFELKKGEALGIIGRNGAGKSTLLKILSRLTAPTEGRALVQGRVGSLLEVGTGFHGELTGRENIYLNGAILGMKKTEIDRKFDEIVAFAEVDQFIDTPVKRYSSGMYMRLAFAVAAHLEPEILIVDEVLAVGDMSFQEKCLGRLGDVATEGRTVLFVSHNMAAIANLCRSVIWLNQGRVVQRGEPAAMISEYLKSNMKGRDHTGVTREGTGEARLVHMSLLDAEGFARDTFSMGETIVVELETEFFWPFLSVYMSLDIRRAETGLGVLHLTTTDSKFNPDLVSIGVHRFRVEIPKCVLYPGSYKIDIFIGIENVKAMDYVQDAAIFTMVPGGCSGRTGPFYSHLGVFHLQSHWKELHTSASSPGCTLSQLTQ